jgi:hypothetical protein
LLDTFAASQLRPEANALDANVFHLRSERGRQELDLLIELDDGRLVAVEVKAGTAPDTDDAKHLAWFRDRYDQRFIAGVVLHTGPDVYPLGDRLVAAPLSALWAP